MAVSGRFPVARERARRRPATRSVPSEPSHRASTRAGPRRTPHRGRPRPPRHPRGRTRSGPRSAGCVSTVTFDPSGVRGYSALSPLPYRRANGDQKLAPIPHETSAQCVFGPRSDSASRPSCRDRKAPPNREDVPGPVRDLGRAQPRLCCMPGRNSRILREQVHQAAEFSIEAVIIANGHSFVTSHDIEELLDTARDAGETIPSRDREGQGAVHLRRKRTLRLRRRPRARMGREGWVLRCRQRSGRDGRMGARAHRDDHERDKEGGPEEPGPRSRPRSRRPARHGAPAFTPETGRLDGKQPAGQPGDDSEAGTES